jgi:hypothetical protein
MSTAACSEQAEWVAAREAARILGTYPSAVHRIVLANGIRVKTIAPMPSRFSREDLERVASGSVRSTANLEVAQSS